jgi:hypothetical protein
VASAHQAWREALAILDDLQHPDASEITARLNGARPPAAGAFGI